MAFPKVIVDGKEIILLSGFQNWPKGSESDCNITEICGIDKLRESVKRHPDAVAFGWLAGKWVPSA